MAKDPGAGGDWLPDLLPKGWGLNGTNSDGQRNPPPQPPPVSTFPNLDVTGSPGCVTYNSDALTQVAKNMQADLDALDSVNGAVARLRTAPKVNIAGYSAWPLNGPTQLNLPRGGQIEVGWNAGAAFSKNANNVTDAVLKFYDDLKNAYKTVIDNMHATVSNYTNADQATQQAANNAIT